MKSPWQAKRNEAFGMKLMKCCVYTLGPECPRCGMPARAAHPPKFSLSDKYAKYRRLARLAAAKA